jgi:hypothetical protein
MLGLPMDMLPCFPTDRKVVLLTEQAKSDPDLGTKISAQLQRGGDVFITTGLLKAVPEVIAGIAEVRCTHLKALVNDFGWNGKASKDLLIPQVYYLTNDAWEIVSAGNPLTKGVTGYPIVLMCPYSKGRMFVLTIPDNFGDLYEYPAQALNVIRSLMGKDLAVSLEGPSGIGLFVYDNDTFIISSFLDQSQEIKIHTPEGKNRLTNLTDEAELTGDNNVFTLTIEPHTYKAFLYR